MTTGGARYVSPGSRIRGANNMLQMSGSLAGVTATVHYTLEPVSGMVLDVWLLTAAAAPARAQSLPLETLMQRLAQRTDRQLGAGGLEQIGQQLGEQGGRPLGLDLDLARDAVAAAMDKAKIPGCTYCQPQVASVGLTEARAKEQGYEVKVGHFPFIGNGKAIALGEPEGMIKTVFDAKTGEIYGAHILGNEAPELIAEYVLAMNMEGTVDEVHHSIHAHPTLSEALMAKPSTSREVAGSITPSSHKRALA